MLLAQLSITSWAIFFFFWLLSEKWVKKMDELVRYFFIASASPSSSKVSNSTGQFRGLSSNQSFPPDFPVAKAVIITVNNCLGWWLWTSACGGLDSPQTVRIKSYPLWSLAQSPTSPPCLFLFTSHHFSFLISQHGHSPHCLPASRCSVKFTADTHT